MSRYLSCVPATFDEETARKLPSPEVSRRAARKPVAAGTGLIFQGAWSGLDVPRPLAGREPDEMGKTAQAWAWYEWVRISLIAAALIAAALVLAGQTAAERAQRQAERPHFPPAAGQPSASAPDEASDDGPETAGAFHHWSDDRSTTVTLDLQKLVFFEGHRLTSPDRVYFDLQDTDMPENLQNKLVQLDVAEKFVRRIRIAEREPGVTRVVLELTPNSDYSAMIAPDPYRLIVRLHAR